MYGGGLVTHPVAGPGNDQVVSQKGNLEDSLYESDFEKMFLFQLEKSDHISSNFSNLIEFKAVSNDIECTNETLIIFVTLLNQAFN